MTNTIVMVYSRIKYYFDIYKTIMLNDYFRLHLIALVYLKKIGYPGEIKNENN